MTDHVAPWRSVFKLHYLTPAEITFVLTTGGHNAGIVNPPGRSKRSYQVLQRPVGGNYVGPDDWLAAALRHEGSWWPEWLGWLDARSGDPVAHPGWVRRLAATTSAATRRASTCSNGKNPFITGSRPGASFRWCFLWPAARSPPT